MSEAAGRKTPELSGKCAVVIGGTSGIGGAIALGFADAGADVIASSRSQASVDEVASLIEDRGAKTLRITSDAVQRETLQHLHDAVIREFGRVDILVNSAGMTRRMSTMECSDQSWNEIMDVNLKGTLYSCQIFGASMLRQGRGRIINIASLSTFVAFHEVAAYGASKAAVGALTRSLAGEWADRGVYVNAIAPGIIPTQLNRKLLETPRGQELLLRTPMRRFGSAGEVVAAAVYLASDLASFTTGEIVIVDGGFLSSGVNE
jgi:NAD(P)-dependent dehydrogenase (short-subunit alcohol dehydrogenase family)